LLSDQRNVFMLARAALEASDAATTSSTIQPATTGVGQVDAINRGGCSRMGDTWPRTACSVMAQQLGVVGQLLEVEQKTSAHVELFRF
jgi:hypothetical protein